MTSIESAHWKKIESISDRNAIILHIYNNTDKTFRRDYFDGTWSDEKPDWSDVESRSHKTLEFFSYVPDADDYNYDDGGKFAQVGVGFTFISDDCRLKFSTQLQLADQSRFSAGTKIVHQITDIGATPIPCNSILIKTMSKKPYSYSVRITIG